MRGALERYFGFDELGTNVRTELTAGLTTFAAMAYIVAVNPAILADAGVPRAAAATATCLAAGFGCLLMGLWARHPIALAPGMGINAYFTYAVVGGMGVDWRTAPGAVFISGILFCLLTAFGVRERILLALPRDLYPAVGAGIGLFLAFIGLRNAGIVVSSEATLVSLGNLAAPATAIALVGLAVTAVLLARRTPGAILIGVAIATLAAHLSGAASSSEAASATDETWAGVLALDIPGALKLGIVDIVFVFLFVDVFDTMGTVIAVTGKAGLVDKQGRIPRVGRVLGVDAVATVFGSLVGTSTVTSYIDSAAGVSAGGRSGFTAVVVGVLFLASLAFTPLASLIPTSAVAPALILVGAMLMSGLNRMDWETPEVSIPGFLTLITIPLTYSIANGIAIGFIAYDVIMIGRGVAGRVSWLVHALVVLFVVRFAYMAPS